MDYETQYISNEIQHENLVSQNLNEVDVASFESEQTMMNSHSNININNDIKNNDLE